MKKSYNNYKIVLITRYLKIKNKLKKKIQKCICTNILYLLHSHIYIFGLLLLIKIYICMK
ncbi:hypothetical protein PFMALIP_04026 [Plasmodium falciparum MaliPS096_E11]|uniref:Uncharacterized protein n=1 Tax=Plasmodium falciparum MaliPS096_E11 TaxID=1036727 RepID=A0A024WN95_PLAFA|nr:hypothetical protein PFMALIP_04026 [Plasmodium falciparum MaliPS096_E11]